MKKILAYFAALCLIVSCQMAVFSTNPTTAATENHVFSDVDAASDIGKSIYKLYQAGIINGHGDGTFAPNDPVTRAQLCKMVNNVCGFSVPSATGFTDVTADKWYYLHVLIGKQAGYINGFDDGTFRGDSYVTREQACAIICRAFGIYDLGTKSEIADPVSEWALTYVNSMISNQLVSLERGNTFRAQENMTRAELSAVLAKFVSETPISYTVAVQDTKGTISDAVVVTGSGTVTITLPADKTISASNRVTVTVTDKNGTALKDICVTINDTKGASQTGLTNASGQVSLPAKAGVGNGGGGISSGNNNNNSSDEMTKEEIIKANQIMLKNLKAVKSDLSNARFTGDAQQIISIVLSCVNDAISIGESGEQLIRKDFVYTNYKAEIAQAKAIYHSFSEEAQAAFIDAVSKEVGQETQDYLISAFL